MPAGPILSDITITPAGAGISRVASSSFVTSGARVTAERSSGRRTSGFLSGESGESILAGSIERSLVESRNAVFSYASTVYDNELKAKGITSAYPVIIGTLPFKNPYRGGQETNIGKVYEIQNSLRDATVTTADLIVNNFYTNGISAESLETTARLGLRTGAGSAFLSASLGSGTAETIVTSSYEPPSELAAIRDSNNEKYNALLAYLPKITSLRYQLINTAKNTLVPSAENLSDIVVNAIATTSAESEVASGGIAYDLGGSLSGYTFREFQTSLSETGDYGNRRVDYIDDDVSKYDTETKSLTDIFAERFLGDLSALGNEQSIVALQYQLLKAILFQLTQGIRIADVPNSLGGVIPGYNSIYSSPFSDLEYNQIGSVERFTYENATIQSDFNFARATLDLAARMISNNYAVPLGEIAEEDIVSTLDKYGLYHAGTYGYTTSQVLLTGGEAEFYFSELTGSDTRLDQSGDPSYYTEYHADRDGETYYEVGNEPVISIKSSKTDPYFISQIPTVLAFEIMQDAGNTNLSDLPKSIDPINDSNPPNVEATYADDVRYIHRLGSSNQTFSPFDISFPEAIGGSLSPISSILLYGDDELDAVSMGLDGIVRDLSDFASKNNAVLSNQCAMNVLWVFYDYFASFFRDSVFGGSTDVGAVIRTILLVQAANDDSKAAALYRALDKRDIKTYYSDEVTTAQGGISPFRTFLQSFSAGNTSNLEMSTFGGEKVDWLNREQGNYSEIDFGFADDTALYESIYPEEETSGSTFNIFNNIVGDLVGIYPTIGSGGTSDTVLAHKIRFAAYTMFLYFLRKMRVKILFAVSDSTIDPDTNAPAGSDYTWTHIKLVWDKEVAAMMADGFKNAFINTEIALGLTQFSAYDTIFPGEATESSEIIGQELPDQNAVDEFNDKFFKYIRSPIKNTVQMYQDAASLLAYQQTILKNQISIIDEISTYYQSVFSVFGADRERATSLISRYLTRESIVELLYRANRYQNVIPNTGITTVATRSPNYRSIVETVFKSIIPSEENLNICIVGIPYGHLERLRLAKEEDNEFFGIKLFADDIRTTEIAENEITWPFGYISNSETIRPKVGGPFRVTIPNLQDDFSSTSLVASIDDDSIALLLASSDLLSLDPFAKSELSTNDIIIDLRAYLVQAALQSYLEDIYGLYVRYASTKKSMNTITPYREEQYAIAALDAAGITKDTEENALEYERLKAMIMMHKDFVTSRMLDELEASPLFDKIVYVLFDGKDLGDILTEFYCKVNV